MKKIHTITVDQSNPPTVELDSQARAAYVRFSKNKIARTEPLISAGCIVTVDFDDDDQVVGIELIGVREFGVTPLMKKAGFASIPSQMAQRTKYIFTGDTNALKFNRLNSPTDNLNSRRTNRQPRKRRSPAEEGVAAAQRVLAKVFAKADPKAAKGR